MLDLLIRGARAASATGEWRVVNIGIREDKIDSIDDQQHPARRVIDAQRLTALPGFVDFHNHTDRALLAFRDGAQPGWRLDPSVRRNHNYLSQGVTTIVTGNCGEGFAHIDQWRELFDGGFGTNVCHFVPYGSLRGDTFGNEAAGAPLQQEQVAVMKTRLAEQLKKGAYGLSIAFDTAPQCFATTEELVEYCQVLAEHGGIYLCHVRHESGDALLRALAEAVAIAERTGVSVHLPQLRIYRSPDGIISATRVLETIEAARSSGLRITASQNPYTTVGGRLSEYFLSHLLSNLFPEQPLPKLDKDAAIEGALAKILAAVDGSDVLVTQCPSHRRYEGLTLSEIVDKHGGAPESVMWQLFSSRDAFLVMNVFSENRLRELMVPEYVFTSSNGEVTQPGDLSVHPRSYGAFARKLSHYVREGVISFEQAARSMSAGPAQFLGLRHRGELIEGGFADLVLVDSSAVQDQLDYLQPNRYPLGFHEVIVNGRPALREHALSGRLLTPEA
jgi:N-acyl-D-amino-acid deacylase